MCIKRKTYSGNPSGFTLIEVIAILTIIGIISAVVITKLSSTASYSVMSEGDIVRSHLRYAQLRAMSDEVPWGILFSATSYTLLRNGVTSVTHLPNENSATHNLQGGVTITSGAGSTVSYDNWGSPGDSNKVIVLSGSETITITKNTGFIQ